MSAPQGGEIFANPVPLGLIGLSIGSAALLPIAFGLSLTPQGLETAAVWALLFGAGGQFLAGILSLANKNVLGGTMFTTFTFLWIINWWTLHSLSQGFLPDHNVLLFCEIVILLILSLLTYAFGYINQLLFWFLFVIDVMFVVRIIKTFTGNNALMFPLGLLTIVMIGISLWLAFAMLINPTVGKNLFPIGGPLFKNK